MITLRLFQVIYVEKINFDSLFVFIVNLTFLRE